MRRVAATLVLAVALVAPASADTPRGLPQVFGPSGPAIQAPGAGGPRVHSLAPARPALPAPPRGALGTPEDWGRCRDAILAAEAEHGIPARLLLAIGRAETGRRSPAGRMEPWPWAVNVEGAGYYLDGHRDAVGFVTAARQRARSIDVGCMQINLHHHPNAFASLDEAFDPTANARYAARFLAELRSRLGGWLPAVGAYHSMTDWRAEAYRARVLANWAAEGGDAALLAMAGRVVNAGTALGRGMGDWFGMRLVTPGGATAERPATATPRGVGGIRVIGPSQ
jgi:hypothetical protein